MSALNLILSRLRSSRVEGWATPSELAARASARAFGPAQDEASSSRKPRERLSGIVIQLAVPALRACRAAVAVTFLAVALAFPAHAAEPTFPALTSRVVDDARIIDIPTEAEIDRKLAELETKTTTQLVVVTLPSLQGLEIEDFGYRLGRHWGIGQKGKNNGALFIVAPNEKAVRIEVGYGLEGTLTDAVSRLVIENAILPRFRAGDFAGGISRGVDDLVQVLEGDTEFVKRAEEQAEGARSTSDAGDIGFNIFIGLLLLFWLSQLMFASRRRRRRGGMPWIIPGGFGGSSSGGWSSGGSFGSGGFGGGSFGGGGGSFGGGGASGRW